MTRFLVIAATALIIGSGGWPKTAAAHISGPFNLAFAGANSVPAEKPAAPEVNPPGDIPDSQVFVKYVSSRGEYDLQVPEGWARTDSGPDVAFADKLDGLSVVISNADRPPNAASVREDQAKSLQATGRAVKIIAIKEIKVSGKTVVLMTYECNSEPNPVTNKQVRLENKTYFFYHKGKLAALRLWAPLGADNVDQWKLISESFRWR